MQHAQGVVRLKRCFCGNQKWDASGQAFGDQAKIAKALTPGGKGKVFCPDCGKPILRRDVIEEKSESPAAKEQGHSLRTPDPVEISRTHLATTDQNYVAPAT